ncbi:hypothetical protein ZTR_11384 [Talaromyces verruculosus]|nr:hypothetical protein ZTR_11384 [Talaromyces verruculosus]
MAEGAVASPLTGENLVPQGVREATATPKHQNQQPATTNAIQKQIYEAFQKRFTKMEQLKELANLVLQQVQTNPNDALNVSIHLEFVRCVRDFASSQGERTEAFADFKGLLEGIQKDITVLRAQSTQSTTSASTGLSNDSATQWRSHNAQRWQADLRHARSLRYLKVLDPGHFFVAARPLPSGDISLRAHHAAAAEVLRQHSDKWVKAFGANACVRVSTWGVVVDGVPVHTVDLQSGIEDFKQQLIAWNHDNWGQGLEVEIAYVGWLAKPRRHEASLVIEFTNPIVANNAIARDTIWQSRIHTNRPYNKEGRCKMCRKCQKYGHVQAQCPFPKYTCGTCAEERPTWQCPSTHSQEIQPKCANCKDTHKTTSASCQVRKWHLDRAKQAAASIDTHRVPPHLQEQARIALENYNPTPQEAAKAPKRRGKAAAKAPAGRTTKRTKTATQDDAGPAQPATQASPEELAAESTVEPTAQSTVQQIAQSDEQPLTSVTQSQTQSIVQPVTQPVEQSITQSTVQPTTQSNPTTRPSTPDARDMPTPTAPTAVRITHKDTQPAKPANQEKRGRGRPPKSKASSNGEQQQQQQTPFSSVEAAIASAEAMMENARMEAEAYESLVSTVANNPPPEDGWETVTRPQRRHTPPVTQGHTATITKRLTPVGKVRKPVQGPPRSPNYMITRRRARELSQESDGAPLPP